MLVHVFFRSSKSTAELSTITIDNKLPVPVSWQEVPPITHARHHGANIDTGAASNCVILKWGYHIHTIFNQTSRNRFRELTYVYQGHSGTGSLRLAPVSPEQGMKWMSFLGLKPTFLRNGTSFSLHSSYLQESHENRGHALIKQWPMLITP